MLDAQVHAREVRKRLWSGPKAIVQQTDPAPDPISDPISDPIPIGWEAALVDFERAQAIDDLIATEPQTVPQAVESEDEEAPPNLPKIHEIQNAVCRFYRIERRLLMSARQDSALARIRHVAMFIAKDVTLRSLLEIGRRFHRDHTTALFGIKKITRLIAEGDLHLAAEIDDIKRSLGVE